MQEKISFFEIFFIKLEWQRQKDQSVNCHVD